MTYLPNDLYNTITQSIPIACVDIIPARKGGNKWELGVITRATGSQQGKLAILGGRIYHNESIIGAVRRHLEQSLGTYDFSFLPSNDISRPFHIQQYFHQPSTVPPDGYDPSKHAIALTYLIEVHGTIVAKEEASDFQWVAKSSIPMKFGYNQHVVIDAAFNFLDVQ